jgi:hypothetical protein
MGSQNGSHDTPRVIPLWEGPLTHFAYSIFCARAGLELRKVVKPHVQVRKRGVVLCGQVEKLSDGSLGDAEFFKVETALGANWYPASAVRLCSGDGNCRCDSGLTLDRAMSADPAFVQAGVVAPPECPTGGFLADSPAAAPGVLA